MTQEQRIKRTKLYKNIIGYALIAHVLPITLMIVAITSVSHPAPWYIGLFAGYLIDGVFALAFSLITLIAWLLK